MRSSRSSACRPEWAIGCWRCCWLALWFCHGICGSCGRTVLTLFMTMSLPIYIAELQQLSNKNSTELCFIWISCTVAGLSGDTFYLQSTSGHCGKHLRTEIAEY